MAKLITPYCLSCLYCRPLGGSIKGSRACLYTYDTGKQRGCDPGDGRVRRVIATDEEREAQAQAASSGFVIAGRAKKPDRRFDDYIWDERGEL